MSSTNPILRRQQPQGVDLRPNDGNILPSQSLPQLGLRDHARCG